MKLHDPIDPNDFSQFICMDTFVLGLQIEYCILDICTLHVPIVPKHPKSLTQKRNHIFGLERHIIVSPNHFMMIKYLSSYAILIIIN